MRWDDRERDPWYQPLKFAEQWAWLNATGNWFKVPYNREHVIIPGEFYADDEYGRRLVAEGRGIPKSKRMGWRLHRESIEASEAFRFTFSDRSFGFRLHRRWYVPKRDRRVRIAAPKKCSRCGRRGRLHRDHIVALSQGGRDVSENLQYLCGNACHPFKTAEEKILAELNKYVAIEPNGWRRKMWEYRLKVLRDLNPPGASSYHSYWSDAKTHYGAWYERPKRKREQLPNQTVLSLIPSPGGGAPR